MSETRGESRAKLLAECLSAIESGGSRALEGACAAHPEIADELRAAGDVMLSLQAAGPKHAPPTAPTLPAVIGRFVILAELGRGGMGIVYRGRDPLLKRDVALKILPSPLASSPQAIDRFKREAEALAHLHHPNIVPVFEVGEAEGGVPFIAMDLVDGESLEKILKRLAGREIRDLRPDSFGKSGTGAKSYAEAFSRIISKIADALESAHRKGVIHRDVKPANILIDAQGEPHLVDFGVALVLGAPHLTRPGREAGTACYMAPEQIEGRSDQIGPATDVFSLGATLYEGLTLHRAFDGETIDEVNRRVLHERPLPLRRLNPAIAIDLQTICLKAIEKEPRDRYPSAGEFGDDLLRYLESRPTRARPIGVPGRALRAIRRNPWPSATVGLVAVAIVVAGFLYWQGHRALRDAADSISIRRADYVASCLQLNAETVTDDRPEPARLRAEVSAKEGALRIAISLALAKDSADPVIREAAIGGWFSLLRQAESTHDHANADFCRNEIAKLDTDHRHRNELYGESELCLVDAPDGTEVHLFRYLPLSEVAAGGEKRLVPVPFDPRKQVPIEKVEGASAVAAIHPGDVMLTVERVEPGSPAEREGIQKDDLIVSILGLRPDESVVVGSLDPGGAAAQAGVTRFSPLVRFDGREVHEMYDVEEAPPVAHAKKEDESSEFLAETGDPMELTFQVGEHEVVVRAVYSASIQREGKGIDVRRVHADAIQRDVGVTLVCVKDLFSAPVDATDVPVEVLHGGAVHSGHLRAGKRTDLQVRATAYPLMLRPENCLGKTPLSRLALQAGSYVLLLRHAGFENLILPVLLERDTPVTVSARMIRDGTTPDGFVYVGATSYVTGGDARAHGAPSWRQRRLGPFWISRAEVTVGEYLEYLNSLEGVNVRKDGTRVLIPRGDDEPGPELFRLWIKPPHADGTFDPEWPRDWPMCGISWQDAEAYCEWRSDRAKAAGVPWTYTMALPYEWEMAARGVDGREFPWGHEFDPAFCCNMHSRMDDAPRPEPVLRYLRDVSPFGVADLAGNAMEWCRDAEPSVRAAPVFRGGAFDQGVVAAGDDKLFRVASFGQGQATRAGRHDGFRLVAHPAEKKSRDD
ncbi:MAG: SUMF1/EgtB/PvdO family nonheme iron enzyme [Planctomycetes bacterium]|nr:SUMF1/EgtB/PvdO family nonheme iron enzyme [Planctomycetota bacterium]